MKKFLLSLVLGLFAGIIDVIPMIAQGLDWYSNISAFIHWIIMGVIIAYTVFDIKGWLKGLIVAEISSLPIAILVFQHDANAVIPIFVMSAILGSLIGFLSSKYVKE
ncbi:MAG: hypothetical protein H6Q75_245 [Firmicutes bacterium]|nr:hypothetical protein [Bacillota bacterium]